ncbi:hypothetical protein [uncultured Sphingomonas sp.]|uniref:hypothetical protein n=1 Tax=uncultured Sphingomonas sp. TaxID=158754 RepID=UPI0035CC699D
MSDLVLVTGATGKVGRRLAARLRMEGVGYRASSRNSDPPFDWTNRDTWSAVLDGVSSIYLIAPPIISDPSALMLDLIRLALSKDVQRLVLQSAAPLPLGAPGLGQVHGWLSQHSTDWAVLRPNWMMQNFSEGPFATLSATRTRYTPLREKAVLRSSAPTTWPHRLSRH